MLLSYFAVSAQAAQVSHLQLEWVKLMVDIKLEVSKPLFEPKTG
jgi:hypothetical protein